MSMKLESVRNRRANRVASNLHATLLAGDGRTACTIRDLSRLGARLEALKYLVPRSHISLICDRIGLLEADVIWCENNVAGITFSTLAHDVAVKLRGILAELGVAELYRSLNSPRAQFGCRTQNGPRREIGPTKLWIRASVG